MFSLKLSSRKSRLASCVTFVEVLPSLLMIPSILILRFYQLRSMYVCAPAQFRAIKGRKRINV